MFVWFQYLKSDAYNTRIMFLWETVVYKRKTDLNWTRKSMNMIILYTTSYFLDNII